MVRILHADFSLGSVYTPTSWTSKTSLLTAFRAFSQYQTFGPVPQLGQDYLGKRVKSDFRWLRVPLVFQTLRTSTRIPSMRIIQIVPTGVAALRDALKRIAPKLQTWMFFLFGVGGISLVVLIFREHPVVTSFRYILTKGCSLRGGSCIR